MARVAGARKRGQFDPKAFLTIINGGRKVLVFPKKKTIFCSGRPFHTGRSHGKGCNHAFTLVTLRLRVKWGCYANHAFPNVQQRSVNPENGTPGPEASPRLGYSANPQKRLTFIG
jgi:hypothetical protein